MLRDKISLTFPITLRPLRYKLNRTWKLNYRPDYCQGSSGNKGGKKFLLPEPKSIDGDVHARPVGDIFSDYLLT